MPPIARAATVPLADLQITQVASGPTVTVGLLLTYTLTITNQRATKAPQVKVVDVLSPAPAVTRFAG